MQSDHVSNIIIPTDTLAALCQHYHVQRLALFGSVLRDDFRTDSDVDVLVEFEAGYAITLLDLAGLQIDLSELLGRSVDLGTPSSLSPYIRQHVLANAQVIYERA